MTETLTAGTARQALAPAVAGRRAGPMFDPFIAGLVPLIARHRGGA
jgi:hypothetical protein